MSGSRLVAGSALALLVAGCGQNISPLPDAPPNVLLIIVDDLNTDLGSYAHATQRSPNIDRIARTGVTFNYAYAQYPQCNQSRASMLTGLYPAQTGVTTLSDNFRDRLANVATLPQHFRSNGYTTARVGKIFHQGVPGDIGTDGMDDPASWDSVSNPAGIENSLDDQVQTIVPNGEKRPGLGGLLSWLAVPGDGKNLTDAKVADVAIGLLKQLRANETNAPFFLAVGFYRPHTPFIAPAEYFSHYPLDLIELPVVAADDRHNKPVAALADRRFQLDMSDLQKRKSIQAYRAAVAFVDFQVGRLLQEVDSLGLSKNTIVVFVSDHGYQLGQHDLWQKGDLFENSARTPLIIKAPGIFDSGKSTNAIVELVDLYPTLVALAGLTSPTHELAGRDLRAVLDSESGHRRAAFTQAWSRGGWTRPEIRGLAIMGESIRDARYRYTEWAAGEAGVELYDYSDDPGEYRNLASLNEYQHIVDRMQDKLAASRDRQLDK